MYTGQPWRRVGERMGEREEEGAKVRTVDPVLPDPTTLPATCTCPSLKNVVGEIKYGLHID